MATVALTFINAGDNAELDAEVDDGLKVEQVIQALITEGFIPPLNDDTRSYMLTIKGRNSLSEGETLATGGVESHDLIRVSVTQRGGGNNPSIFLSKKVRTHRPQYHQFPYQSYLFSKKPHSFWRYHVPDEKECESNQPRVAILESALEAIFYHASNDKQNERFGILIGGVFHDQQSGEDWIEILDLLPAIQIYADNTSVEVSDEEIRRLNVEIDAISDQSQGVVRRIGWYHTHLDRGIFMSDIDRTNQKLFYNADWQVALVADPFKKQYGIFTGSQCHPVYNKLFVIPDEEAETIGAPAYQSWKNIMMIDLSSSRRPASYAPLSNEAQLHTEKASSSQNETCLSTKSENISPNIGAVSQDTYYSSVSFPGNTVVGRTEALRVAITYTALNTQAIPLTLELPSDTTQLMKVDAHVVFSPLDFDLLSPNIQTISISLGSDSVPVIFKLQAKQEGRKTIAIEFFQNTCYLGRTELVTTVKPKKQRRPLTTPIQEVSRGLLFNSVQNPPDLTILFDRVPVKDDRCYYSYRLLSPIRELNLYFDEFRSPETSITPQDFLEEIYSSINRMITNTKASEFFFFERLNSIGMNLYNRLFPDDLKILYWTKLRDIVKSIVILSFEPWIPWEVVLPFDPQTNQVENGFLCEKFDLTRWLIGAGYPDIINLDILGLVVSVSELKFGEVEVQEIKKLLGSKVKDVPSSAEAVYRLLKSKDCSSLHFACHGSFNKNNPDLSALFFEDGTWLTPIDIDGDRLTFARNRPLVFLNACETGQSGHALTGIGGWAEAFAGRAKCSGFIGSTWKAKDESAATFAIEFYHNLLKGLTIAEAARLARLDIKKAGDPTWLSYTVYANPLAHLNLNNILPKP